MWRIPTESDLTATLSATEIAAFRRSATVGDADPVVSLIVGTAEFVRGFMRKGGVKMDPTPASIPDGLILPAMAYATGEVLKRINIEMNRDRSQAKKDALDLFKSIGTRDYHPEPFGETDDSGGGASPAFVVPEHVLD